MIMQGDERAELDGGESNGTFFSQSWASSSATRLRKGTPMQGFKDFLFRGNLIELAVAFIIGGAFATLVQGFTKIVIELLAKLGGAPNFDQFTPGGLTSVGPFLTGLVSFIILAAVVYFGLVKPYEAFSARLKKPTMDAPLVQTTEDILLEIRDLLAAQKSA
jgi:large conductance mechanosensitive channel